MRIGVILASVGRPRELAQWTERLLSQTVAPHLVVYSVTRQEDLPAPGALYPGARVIFGSTGLPSQRNRGIDLARQSCDLLAFFDDDYVASRFALERATDLFAGHPDIAGANGMLLADGINSQGIPFAEALAMVEAHDRAEPGPIRIERDLDGLYGCNMIYRVSGIADVRFDERLPLYAWQEDVDFAARVRVRGRIVKSNAFAGVHQGVKSGRGSGLRLGYSQIANPLYLWRKGTLTARAAIRLMGRNLASNVLRSFRPEPWVDRKGRLRGNSIAIRDALSGRLAPENILNL